jgi:peptidoglycan/LPS O-acetylase OafA/YrhL
MNPTYEATVDAPGLGAKTEKKTVVHVESLDGVRAIAIFAVMCVHAAVPGFQLGWLGVDLFFALSGFLITTLLLSEFERKGKISYGDFLVRRGLRLVPAYAIYVLIVTYGIWGWSGSVVSDHAGWTPLQYTAALWTYTVNFAPQGGIWNGQAITVHLWSLAVEQQYYLVWPLVVMALAGKPRTLLRVSTGIFMVSLLAFVITPEGLYKISLLPTRGFTLMLASTVAIYAYHYKEKFKSLPWSWINLSSSFALILAICVSIGGVLSNETIRAFMLPFLSLAFTFWMAGLWYRQLSNRGKTILFNPYMQYVGKVSYGIYIYHELVRETVWLSKPFFSGWPVQAGFGVRLLTYFVASILIAAISYELLEKRFLRLKSLYR